MRKILVPVKRVVDPNIKVRVNADESGVELTNVKMALNPFCEIAVEEAIRQKEQGEVDEIIVVSIGPAQAQEQLRTAMALGADRAILVESEQEFVPLSIAKLLHAIVQKEQPDLVLLGKQSIDGDNNQTGQMLAALMGVSQATFVSRLRIDGNTIEAEREIDGGLQRVVLGLPAVVTADLRLNEPRYASLPNIMKAKRKPLESLSIDELGVTLGQHQKVLKISAPPARQAGVMVSSVEALVDKLKQEAKVI